MTNATDSRGTRLTDAPASGLRLLSDPLPGAPTATTETDLLSDIAACLARVRDHLYRANVGSLLVEAGRDLLDLDADVREEVGGRRSEVGCQTGRICEVHIPTSDLRPPNPAGETDD